MQLPICARRLRSFKLSLGAQLVVVVLMALCAPAPTAAQFTLCNSGKNPITFAFSTTRTDEASRVVQTMVEGFNTVAPGACTEVSTTSLLSIHAYLYAWEQSNPKINWGGPEQRCVSDSVKISFQYTNQQANPPCAAGQAQAGFFLVSDGTRAKFKATLNEPSQ